jgi:hypothetical protein
MGQYLDNSHLIEATYLPRAIHGSLADAVSGELVVVARLVEDLYDVVRPTLDLPKRTLILMEGVISARICVIVV